MFDPRTRFWRSTLSSFAPRTHLDAVARCVPTLLVESGAPPGMVELVNLLVRADGWSHVEFVRRLREEHVRLVEDLPGVERYTTSVSRNPERTAYDAVTTLSFEDDAALGAAFDGEPGRALQVDAAEFADMDASETFVVDEAVHLDG